MPTDIAKEKMTRADSKAFLVAAGGTETLAKHTRVAMEKSLLTNLTSPTAPNSNQPVHPKSWAKFFVPHKIMHSGTGTENNEFPGEKKETERKQKTHICSALSVDQEVFERYRSYSCRGILWHADLALRYQSRSFH